MSRRRATNVVKSLRDYMVPIIWTVLILLLMYSIFSWNEENTTNEVIKFENKIPLELTLDNDSTEAYVVYPWENKQKIEWDISIYKWERVLVKEGSVSMDFLSVWNIALDKNWDLKYNENWELTLNSSNLWVDLQNPLTVNMRYAKAVIKKGSHVSLSQNEMWSIIYNISWNVEVENNAWKSTILAPGQKINISRLDASREDLDLELSKEKIDEFFKTSSWFLKNNWNLYFEKIDNKTWTGTNVKLSTSNVLSFDNLVDESYISSNSIDISWKYKNDSVSNIKLNGVNLEINKIDKTFDIKSVDTSSKENNLIFKIYDNSWDLIDKVLYTVYYESWDTTSNSNFNVKNYSVDWSKFVFTSPTTKNIFTTTYSFVTIKWKVLEPWVSKVSVNWYELKSFKWSTWRYHADVRYNNLKDWTNVYEIKYYDKNGNILYINNFTIIKKPLSNSSKDVKKISGEVKL
jgi:hypothetical protein